MKINNYYLIILTALFSSVSLIMDQTVFQIEKRIINLETNLSDDKNNIAISNSKYSYFNKSFQHLTYEGQNMPKMAKNTLFWGYF